MKHNMEAQKNIKDNSVDCLQLAQQLVQCESITPNDAGCLDIIQNILEPLGFQCHRLVFGDVDNLYARWGDAVPNFCFAGHTDVVPIVDEPAWTYPPFQGKIYGDILHGRGVVDMKGAIAAYVSALTRIIPNFLKHKGSFSLLLTSDEEGIGINGTRRVIKWLQDQGKTIDVCLVGEPTCIQKVGDMVKVGRRGSLNGKVTVSGVAGHVAYPENAINPIPVLLSYLKILQEYDFDEGNVRFDPTNLEITTVDVGNDTTNIIPAKASARFNIRFSDEQTGDGLVQWLNRQAKRISPNIQLDLSISGESFYCPDERLKRLFEVILKNFGHHPVFSTSGGTSDARFIKDICPVIEFGLVNKTAHKINEQCSVQDIRHLSEIYEKILNNYF